MTSRRIPESLIRFALVGGLTVAIDAASYGILGAVGVGLDLAKGLSFGIGAVFAYIANWRFTFGARRSHFAEALFVAVYLCALGINVGLNALVRAVLGPEMFSLVSAFIIATGVSAIWNYLGMSRLVFRSNTLRATAPDRQKDESR